MESETKTTSVFVKPEFWMTVVTSVSGLLLAFGAITPEQNQGIATYAPNLIGALLSLLSTFKFISVQHAAKVEVFRAMCAVSMQKAELHKDNPGASTLSVSSAEAEVAGMAKAAGL